MQPRAADPACRTFELEQLFEHPAASGFRQVLQSETFSRIHRDLDGGATLVLDSFPATGKASCCFLRLAESDIPSARFTVQGGYRIVSCPSGGWLVKPAEATLPSYWIPHTPLLRTFETSGRILSEKPTAIVDFEATSSGLAVEIKTSSNMQLDMTLWCFAPEDSKIPAELERPITLEKQALYLWTSKAGYRSPADVYLYLVHGHVYTNRFLWPRGWKICSELDAYGLYVLLQGLELATDKKLYGLLKRQLLFSVITRQSSDGGWYHGEWVNNMESHYRYHNGAMHMLESALEDSPDDTVRSALERATLFISNHTDQTGLGLWFLHDSLELSADRMDECWEQTRSKWIPSQTLGKSPTNKLILNTHIDTIISMHRYQEITGDSRYEEQIEAAHSTACSLLKLNPAEQFYQLVYWAIGLTLLPLSDAQGLPAPIRAIKRLSSNYLIPQLHRIKRLFPRFVMPGGLIERHLSPIHFNIQYHAVNTMDLARVLRYFPDSELMSILDNAISFVADNNILKYWSESGPRQYALVVWVDAMYRACLLKQDEEYRNHLARAILYTEDTGLGQPPVILGAEDEAIRRSEQKPCPSPTDTRLRVANLSHGGHMELLVVNKSPDDLELKWEQDQSIQLSWRTFDKQTVSPDDSPLQVPARGWLLGKEDG